MSRKLDAAIAEALGYKAIPGLGLCVFVKEYEDHRGLVADRWVQRNDGVLPHYSTDGNAMLELDAEMRARGWQLETAFWGNVHFARFCHGQPQGSMCAEKLPKAVALAAYKALTGKEWAG